MLAGDVVANGGGLRGWHSSVVEWIWLRYTTDDATPNQYRRCMRANRFMGEGSWPSSAAFQVRQPLLPAAEPGMRSPPSRAPGPPNRLFLIHSSALCHITVGQRSLGIGAPGSRADSAQFRAACVL